MSLVICLQRLNKGKRVFSSAEIQELQALAAKNRETMGPSQAEVAAVQSLLDEAIAEQSEVEGLIREAAPALAAVPAPVAAPAVAQPVRPEAQPKEAKRAAKIGDFGERLAGARKDYAAELKDAEDVDAAAEPLSKSWPEPDYQRLLDGGADPFVVAFIHAARDEVPTKPQKSWKLKGWVDSVQTLRGVARGLLDGSISREQLASKLVLRAFDNVRRNVGSRAELYELVGHDKSLKGITFAEHHYSLYKGESNVRKWVVEQKAKATMFSNWPRELAVADTKEAMLDQFRAKFMAQEMSGKDAPSKGKFSIYRKRGQDGVFIGKKIGREHVDLKKLPDIAAARKFLDENTADLESLLEKYKETPFERNAENQPRVGDDHRNGAPVTPKIFEDAFGFRGVQFGNYVEQDRRQSDLNQAYDGLMDLAAVLGVPPRALSLNGRLGLAFGARGKGGRNAPAAHYEPGNVVINLTKNAGPGSLAHEWWHGADNYFGKNDGGAAYGTGGILTDKTRDVMRQAFNEVKAATQQGTLRRRAMELDKRKSKPYWDTPIELSARSFESYVIAKLKDQGAANDYLANVVSKEFWDAQEALRAGSLAEGKPAETYPYPTPDEVPAVRAAFDHFFRVVETREDDAGNVAMFSRNEPARAGVSMDDAKGVVAAIRKAMPASLDIILHDAAADAPQSLREEIERAGAAGDVEAAYHNGNIHVFPRNIASTERMQFVVAHHEIRHHGIRSQLGSGDELGAAMLSMWLGNKALRRAAQAKIDAGLANTRALAVEEALADMDPEAVSSLKGWPRLVAAIRQLLRQVAAKFRKAGLTALADSIEPKTWTDADVARFVLKAEDVSRGGLAAPQAVGTVFSGTTDAVPADTNAPGQPGGAQGADQGKSVAKSPYVVQDFTPAPKDRMSIAMIREANRRGMRHAKSGDQESYYTPVLQVAYNLGHKGVDLSNAPIVTGVRYGKAPDYGVSWNSADQISEAGTSLAQVRGEDEISSSIWFRDRKAYEYRGVLTQEGSDGEALILPLHVENLDGDLPGVNHAQALKEQLANQSDQPAPDSGGAVFSRGSTSQVAKAVRNTVNDHLGNAGAKVSWWDKTLATQYAKAEKFPAFKRVFDHAQQYLEDVSSLANQAADKAPSILPKLETWKDLKKFGLSEADAKAVAGPIFTGTLTDEKVYTDDELRAKFKLTPEQIGQYREFLATVNESLDQVVAADVLRLLGDKNPALRELAVEDRAALRDGVLEYLDQQIAEGDPDEAADLQQTAASIREKYDRVDDLKARGYAPLMRFGRYAVNVEDQATGESLFFGLYESRPAANAAFRDLQGDPKFAKATITQGVLSEEQYKLFSTVPMESLEMFAEAIGAENSDVFQAYLKLAKNNRSALKRMIQRKGTAGFSEDVPRVLAAFTTSNARMASNILNMGAAKDAAGNIRDGDIKDEAIKLVESVSNPGDRAGWIRGLMFTQFIGGSVASAVVNLTQPLTMTLPYLSQFGGVGKASARLLAAGRTAAGGKPGNTALALALKRAEADGVVSPQEIHHLVSQASGSWGNHPWLKRAAFIWSAPFSLAEQFNRRVTFIAAWNTAKEQGIDDAFGFASKAVVETQGLYNAGNMPNWARTPLGATALTFKQFSISYLEWMGRMWRSGPEGKKAVGIALALLVLAAGTDGLPFADDLDDLVDTLAQALGYDLNSKKARRNFVANTLGLGDEVADVAARGFSAITGVPLDVSMRMSMGNLIPATGLLLRSNTDKSGSLLEVAGPGGSLAKQYLEGAAGLLRGDLADAAKLVMPLAVQNAIKGAEMAATGEARDTLGRKVMDVGAADAAVKAVGFNPSSIARETQKIGMIRRSEQLAKNVEGDIAADWARAIVDRDQDAIADARRRLAEWNQDNPESPIRITMAQLVQRTKKLRQTREQRFITTVAPERRRAVAEEMQ